MCEAGQTTLLFLLLRWTPGLVACIVGSFGVKAINCRESRLGQVWQTRGYYECDKEG